MLNKKEREREKRRMKQSFSSSILKTYFIVTLTKTKKSNEKCKAKLDCKLGTIKGERRERERSHN